MSEMFLIFGPPLTTDSHVTYRLLGRSIERPNTRVAHPDLASSIIEQIGQRYAAMKFQCWFCEQVRGGAKMSLRRDGPNTRALLLSR